MHRPVFHRSPAIHPALIAALIAVLSTAGCGREAGPAGTETVEPLPARSNILLITVDTLRADHLSSYGYPRATSPVIDALAAEGVRFDQATVQWPKTAPSFASIFTATYPKDNGIVRRVGDPLPCAFRMLAEMLREAGYSTHAVVANGALARDFYFDQGFDTYLESWTLQPPAAEKSGGQSTDPTGAGWVTTLASQVARNIDRSRPYFLWVHYLDPHTPYVPPEGFRDRFQDDEHFDPETRVDLFLDKEKQQMMGIGAGQVLDGRDELAFYVARYDAEIAYADREIGVLLDNLRGEGLLDRTLTALTSDHGESLGEHHYFFDHGRFSFETCLRVPFILHYPEVLKPRVDPDPVELIHLAPTLLEAAGVSLDEGRWMQGRSLTPGLRSTGGAAPEAASRPVYAEAGWETKNKWQKVVRDGRYKLVFAQTRPAQRWIGGEGVRFTLFDLEEDPGETENRAEDLPEEVERLKRALWEWENAERFPVLIDPPSETCQQGERSMTRETEDLLRSLGYLAR